MTVPLALSSRWQIRDEAVLLTLLESRVRVAFVDGEDSLVLAAIDRTPEHAAALANAIADRFVTRKDSEAKAEANARVRRLELEIEERGREIGSLESHLVELARAEGGDTDKNSDLRRRLISSRNLLHSLEAKHQLAVLEADEAVASARVVAPAQPDHSVALMSFWLSLPGLFFLGLSAGIGVVAVSAFVFRRNHWDTLSELTSRLHLQFAGFAPLTRHSPVSAGELPPVVLEPYRDLRNRLLRLPVGDCLIMTLMPLHKADPSAEAIATLACVLADAGRTVLVIDADFRNPRLHPCFDAAHHPGLSDFLTGEMRLEETVIKSRRANLWFMPTGPLPEDPGGLLNGKRMDDLIWDMRSRFDFILIASPSIREYSDAGVLAGLADFTTVITPYAGHSVRRLRETQVVLELVKAPLSGVMLTSRVDVPTSEVQTVRLEPVPLVESE